MTTKKTLGLVALTIVAAFCFGWWTLSGMRVGAGAVDNTGLPWFIWGLIFGIILLVAAKYSKEKTAAGLAIAGTVTILGGFVLSFYSGIGSTGRYLERCANSSCSHDAGYVPEARGSIEKIKGGESKAFNVIGSFEILNNSVGYYLELSPPDKEWCWIGSPYGSVWHTRDGVLATRTSSLDGYRTELVLKGVESLHVSVFSQKAGATPITGKDQCSKQKHPWAF